MFCSSQCYGESIRTLPKYLFCIGCGKKFERPHRQGKLRKYCSRNCYIKNRTIWNKHKARVEAGTPCPICRKPVRRNRTTCGDKECIYRFLSTNHKLKGVLPPSQTGKKWGIDYPIEHHNWRRGGTSDLRHQIRASDEWKIWRNSIFQRDDFTCQKCKERGGKLQADHCNIPFAVILFKYKIKTLADAKKCKELWNINNGKTLCVSCHQKTKTYGWKGVYFLKKYMNENTQNNNFTLSPP